MDDDTKKKPPPPPVPLSRQQRRAMKKDRLKLIAGGKRAGAPSVDMSQPAGRFAFHLHEFIVRYMVRNPDLERTARAPRRSKSPRSSASSWAATWTALRVQPSTSSTARKRLGVAHSLRAPTPEVRADG